LENITHIKNTGCSLAFMSNARKTMTYTSTHWKLYGYYCNSNCTANNTVFLLGGWVRNI